MALYRCAACGSPRVMVGSEKDGFSYKKAVAGTLVFGMPGVVAGLDGKAKQVYKCPDCGLTMDAPMAFDIKMLIDLGVMSETARNQLVLDGMKIDWNTLKSRYKNIESGLADADQAERKAKTEATVANDKNILQQKACASQKEFDDATDILKKFFTKFGYYKKEDKVFDASHPVTKTEYESVLQALNTFVENCYKYLPPESVQPYKLLEYRGLKQDIDSLFNEYVIQYCFANIGIPFVNDRTTSDIIFESNPFVPAFLRTYGEKNLNSWVFLDRPNKTPLITPGFAIGHLSFLSFGCDISEMGNSIGKERADILRKEPRGKLFHSVDTVYLPRYMIFDDKLYYWSEWNRYFSVTGTQIKYKELIDLYFKNNSAKKTEYNKFMKEIDSQISRLNDLEKEKEANIDKEDSLVDEIEDLKYEIDNRTNEITDIQAQISKLEKKIFGKAKAQIKISELNGVIAKHEEEIKKLQKKIEALDKDADKARDDAEALKMAIEFFRKKIYAETLPQLFNKMSNFISWITE